MDLIQPVLPIKNVTFSTMTVAGVEWVCEQLSETQCKPLYPQVNLSRTFRPFYLIHIPYLKIGIGFRFNFLQFQFTIEKFCRFRLP